MGDRQRINGATTGAIGLGGTAVFLGTCCVTSLGVVLFGVTGAVALARLAFLQPYLLIASVGLLAWAFWSAYRQPADCADGACETANRRRSRKWVWIAAVVVLVLSALSFAPLFVSLN